MAWTIHADTCAWLVEIAPVAIGNELGLVMPNLTTTIQNVVAFYRSLGDALGMALAGAGNSVVQIGSFPAPRRIAVVAAYCSGLTGAFCAGAILAALGFLIVLFLPELPLWSASVATARLDPDHPTTSPSKVSGHA